MQAQSKRLRMRSPFKSKKTGYLTGKIEVRFLDIYEIRVFDINKESHFYIGFNATRSQLGESHTIGVNTNSKNLLFQVLEEIEITPLQQSSQDMLESSTIGSRGIEGQTAMNSSPTKSIKIKQRGFFEFNVAEMFAKCFDNKQKLITKQLQFSQQLPIFEKVSPSGQAYADRNESLLGFVLVEGILNINYKEDKGDKGEN